MNLRTIFYVKKQNQMNNSITSQQQILDKLGIAVRTGHHCAQPIMDYYKIPGTVRASFSFYNTKKEIDLLAETMKSLTIDHFFFVK